MITIKKKITTMCNDFKKDDSIRVISLKITSVKNKIFNEKNNIMFITD